MDETEGFQCLGQSNWTICSPLSQFCSEIFPISDFHTGEYQFLITTRAENEADKFGNKISLMGCKCSSWTEYPCRSFCLIQIRIFPFPFQLLLIYVVRPHSNRESRCSARRTDSPIVRSDQDRSRVVECKRGTRWTGHITRCKKTEKKACKCRISI